MHIRPGRLATTALALTLVAGCASEDDGGDAPPAETDTATSQAEGATSTETQEATETSSPVAGAECPAPEPLEERATVRVINQTPLEFTAPVRLGDHLGEFEKENIELEYMPVPATEGWVLMANEQADVALTASAAGFFNVANQFPLRWVAGNFGQNPESMQGLWARTETFDDPENPDIAELEGATIGTTGGPGGVVWAYVVREVLEPAGLGLDDVTFQTLGATDILVALENGSIDAGWLLDPIWTSAEGNDDLVYLVGQPEDDPLGGVYYGPTLIDDRPEVGHAFMRAMVRTINSHLTGNYYADDEVVDGITEFSDQPEESLTRTPPLIFTEQIGEDTVQWLQETYLSVPGTLDYDEPLPEDDVVDRQFITQATCSGA